jgi:predicted nucleic acid-binding protein
VIYVDSSVLLAQLFAEDRRPPRTLWDEPLITSRLAEYEVWNRVHARDLAGSHGEAARELLARISMVELSPIVLGRALEPFPTPVRTLDALHLASLDYLLAQRLRVTLATYDARMAHAASRMSIPLEAGTASPPAP